MFTTRTKAWTVLAMMMLAGFLAACGGAADDPSAQDDASPGTTGMEGMPTHDMSAMAMDPATMRQHAQEMDSALIAMRQHVQAMRQLNPDEWHTRMEEHAPRVGGMVGMMDRQMREMDMGMGMGAQMMGITAEEHLRMMEEMRTLRTEAEQLQTAAPPEVRDRMPAHLDRLDRMTEMMERVSSHMRAP